MHQLHSILRKLKITWRNRIRLVCNCIIYFVVTRKQMWTEREKRRGRRWWSFPREQISFKYAMSYILGMFRQFHCFRLFLLLPFLLHLHLGIYPLPLFIILCFDILSTSNGFVFCINNNGKHNQDLWFSGKGQW